jgi:hypothetical protein
VPRLYNVERRETPIPTRVEAGSNTSTVTLRVVGGDEKGSLKSESPKGLGPEKGYLARASTIYKRQTRSLVREGVHKNTTVTVKE